MAAWDGIPSMKRGGAKRRGVWWLYAPAIASPTSAAMAGGRSIVFASS